MWCVFAADDLPNTPTKTDSSPKTESPTNEFPVKTISPPTTPTKSDEKPVTVEEPSPQKVVEQNGTSSPDGKKSPSPQLNASETKATNNDNKKVEELYDIPVGECLY